MTETKELKKCPFCGRKATTFHIPENDEKEMKTHPKWEWNYPGMWVIGCDTEMCMGNINHFTMVFVDEQSAIETWNKRVYPEQPKVSEWILCSESLPETNVDVRVSVGFFVTDMRITVARMFECEGKKCWNIKSPVYAWQPLPEHYQS